MPKGSYGDFLWKGPWFSRECNLCHCLRTFRKPPLSNICSMGSSDMHMILDKYRDIYIYNICKLWTESNTNVFCCPSETILDHNDPSKPLHRLTNGLEPSKTIESDGRKIKDHWKTIDGNGQTSKKHPMMMVASKKTMENLPWFLQNYRNLQWFPKKPLNLSMVLSNQYSLKGMELYCGHNYYNIDLALLLWSQLFLIHIYCSCKPNLPHPTNKSACFYCFYTATSSPAE